jgi:hypothetical protein
MKSTFTGVSARIKRRFTLIVKGVSTLVLTLIAAVYVSAAFGPSYVLVAECYPSNDLLVGPLRPLAKNITGAIGGLIPVVAGTLIVAGAIYGLILVVKNESIANIFKWLIGIVVVVIAVPLSLLVLGIGLNMVSNVCPTSVFG